MRRGRTTLISVLRPRAGAEASFARQGSFTALFHCTGWCEERIAQHLHQRIQRVWHVPDCGSCCILCVGSCCVTRRRRGCRSPWQREANWTAYRSCSCLCQLRQQPL
jgi:hypothetical protein